MSHNSIEALVIAVLDVLDEDLTPHQRDLADKIYDLANSLEYTEEEQS